MTKLADAARPFVDGFTYDPGHSDLDNEQPIHVRVTLGDWRKLSAALMDAAIAAMPSECAAICQLDGCAMLRAPSPEAGRSMVLVPRELLRHAQYKCSDLGVQLAIHNYLADESSTPQEQR